MSATPLRRAVLAASVILLSSGCVVVEGLECRHREAREAVLPAAGLRRVEIDALAGSLSVQGAEDATEIRVDGDACSRRRRDLESVALETRLDGDRAIVEAVIPGPASRRGARLDLTLTVPSGLAVVVNDSSGSVEIADVAAVTIDDSSGSIRLDRIAGGATVSDGSGSVEIHDVGGEVRIDDDSGDVVVVGAGKVTVDDDGSGDLEISSVAGDVAIHDDGSGEVEVTTVGGDLLVEDDDDDLVHHDVRGRVEVR
jgi:hypothetical protein